jgi:oligogalacturonide lyase
MPKRKFRDPFTGRAVWQVTDGEAPHHHLYYLNPTWTPDGRFLLCVRYDDGVANLVAVEEATAAYRQLTERTDMYGFSACPAHDGSGVYFTAGHRLWRVELADGRERPLADFGEGVPGNCALSADGAWIVTNVRRDKTNAITVVAADGSEVREVLRTEREVGHVQFSPGPDRRILYSGGLTERLWLVGFDGRGDRLLYRQAPGEFLVHEFWARDGSGDLFVVHWPFALLRLRLAGTGETPAPAVVVEMNAWHVSSRSDGGLLVCDTNHPDTGLHLIDPRTGRVALLCASASSNLGSQWRYTFPREGAHMDVTIFRSRASGEETPWGPQWTHPHPSFHPAGDRVAFTSDRSGLPQVYVVEGVPGLVP